MLLEMMMTNDNSVLTTRSFWSDGLMGVAFTLWLTERERGRNRGESRSVADVFGYKTG